MDLIRPGIQINFMKFKNIGFGISIAAIAVSLGCIFLLRGLNYGIDFAGGTVVQVRFTQEVGSEELRAALKTIGMEQARIQSVEDAETAAFLIRTAASSEGNEDVGLSVKGALETAFGADTVEIRRVEMVGGEVSKDLKQKGFLSLFYAGLGILIYIWWRFELRFSFGAILALVHDVIITVGIFSLTGREITLPVIAALLTIIGYSLNDTIVVFDRIRENMKKPGARDLSSLLDTSISQTLSRTLLTSLTTFLVVLCLFVLGGSVINDFAFAMLVGVIVGTYSSIFVASPMLLVLAKDKK